MIGRCRFPGNSLQLSPRLRPYFSCRRISHGFHHFTSGLLALTWTYAVELVAIASVVSVFDCLVMTPFSYKRLPVEFRRLRQALRESPQCSSPAGGLAPPAGGLLGAGSAVWECTAAGIGGVGVCRAKNCGARLVCGACQTKRDPKGEQPRQSVKGA